MDRDSLDKAAALGALMREEADTEMTTDLSGSMAEDAEGDQTTAPGSAAEESTGKDDLIDRFMEQPAAM